MHQNKNERFSPKNITLSCVSHTILLILCATPSVILVAGISPPFKSGFFCNDESIRYAYKPDTIPTYMVIAIGPGVCILNIVINEFMRKRRSGFFTPSDKYSNIPKAVVNIYIYLGIFIYGVAFEVLIVTCSKYLLGRLRPNFISVCNPDFTTLNCSQFNYIILNDDECKLPYGITRHTLKESRLSFPSGHASHSMYCAMAFMLYVTHRWKCSDQLKILPAVSSVIMITLALLCGETRINDNKHHPVDVLGGFLNGALVAVFAWMVMGPMKKIIKKESSRNRSDSKKLENWSG